MCNRFLSVIDAVAFKKSFGLHLPGRLGYSIVRAGTETVLIRMRLPAKRTSEDITELEAVFGFFGMLPQWSDTSHVDHQTFNTPFATILKHPSFSTSWKNAHRCIIPAMAIYEPDWRTGKAEATKISRLDGKPMGIAGLWSLLPSPVGEQPRCFTMLTVAAEGYPPMQNLLGPNDAKRMVVILPDDAYDEWLQADQQSAEQLMQLYPADKLLVKNPSTGIGRL